MKKFAKIAILVVAPLALAWGVWSVFLSGDGTNLPSEYAFADVQTGEVVYKARGTIISIPMLNPATKAFTLFPVEKNDQGQWVVVERYRGALKDLPAGTATKLDSGTFVVDAH